MKHIWHTLRLKETKLQVNACNRVFMCYYVINIHEPQINDGFYVIYETQLQQMQEGGSLEKHQLNIKNVETL